MGATRLFREKVCTFGRHGALVGVVTHPTGSERRMPVLILGAGIIHKVGPSRISVELARTLAAEGHTALRFDLAGIGDSPRAPEPSLEASVTADIKDAITQLLASSGGWEGGVALVGFCSGADNAFFVALSDPRVQALAMFDPTVHETAGFRRRLMMKRLTSLTSWLNVLSGRSLWLRLKPRSEQDRPPGYYGLLIADPQTTDEGARKLAERGVRALYVISGGAQSYCNAPEQVAESMPTGYSPEHFSVAWEPGLDHVLSSAEQRRRFSQLVLDLVAQRPATRVAAARPAAPVPSSVGSPSA